SGRSGTSEEWASVEEGERRASNCATRHAKHLAPPHRLPTLLSLCPRTPAAGAVADRGNSPVEVGGFAARPPTRLAIFSHSQQLFRDPAVNGKEPLCPPPLSTLRCLRGTTPVPPATRSPLSISRSAFSLSSTRRQPSPLSSMEGPNLCCSLYRALALDPVPVMGEELYVPGAEGVNLKSLREDTLHLCSSHRFNFRRAVAELIATLGDAALLGDRPGLAQVLFLERRCARAPTRSPKPTRRATPPRAAGRTRRRLAREKPDARLDSCGLTKPEPAAAAHRWLIRTERATPSAATRVGVSDRTPRACPAYTRTGRASLTSLLKQRPLTVVDQFNSWQTKAHAQTEAGRRKAAGRHHHRRAPGRDNFSALYVIGRRIALPAPEYGNRLFGEAAGARPDRPGSSAGDLPRAPPRPCGPSKRGVIDPRWNALDAMSSWFERRIKIRACTRGVVQPRRRPPEDRVRRADVAVRYSNTLPRSASHRETTKTKRRSVTFS
ncbi:hypothetical protein Q5P01_000664, partial [Channa striata]